MTWEWDILLGGITSSVVVLSFCFESLSPVSKTQVFRGKKMYAIKK